jgi:predicted DNA-binding transcriptional regulator AlpA
LLVRGHVVVLTQEDSVATLHLFATYSISERGVSDLFGGSRPSAVGLAHLLGMDTTTRSEDATERPLLAVVEQVISLSDLCAHLHVPVQTIYDLRSQGRGPRGFRVGRELRFRVSEIEAWLERMERDDEHRHVVGRA